MQLSKEKFGFVNGADIEALGPSCGGIPNNDGPSGDIK